MRSFIVYSGVGHMTWSMERPEDHLQDSVLASCVLGVELKPADLATGTVTH